MTFKNLSRLFAAVILFSTVTLPLSASKETGRQSYKIYVDKEGVMRRSDTKEEVSYYGTNYTLPFAHAYRAVGELGLDRKAEIDKDVYHMKRLGFNGFRLHLWDVELADSAGNLIDNQHLDLLDYLISQLEKEGIDIILTAQTNFGNGYPEKNIDTGSYSYDYGKCEIHSNKIAQDIQANYLQQLASHINPYTGKSYSDDNAIIAIEINNEPCHTDSKKEVTAYINKMVKALKKGGFTKPILYNVSHNPDVTEAYYDADIQGTTYQWYPTSLVSGHQRKGNFLPYIDQYPIPWKDSIKNYNKMARVVYEFDPGDVLYSYLYPAIARTFRKEGFQWITQFAYDPMAIAKYNTEYQTHFLNLAYTPSKAISMLIAGEAAREIPRGYDFGKFPADTVFGNFMVSHINDLSIYNTPEKFYYSNTNNIEPKDTEKLKNIAGVGSSKVVDYTGTGAYFLDELQPGLWRLEVMPDVVLTSDPFDKPSLKKEIGKIFYSQSPMKINLPQLGNKFFYAGINDGNRREGNANNGEIMVYPGTYLLSSDKDLILKTLSDNGYRDSGINNFVAPIASEGNNVVIHSPLNYINPEEDLVIEARIIGNTAPETVFVYPEYISFWNEHNNLIPMEKVSGNLYRATIPKEDIKGGNSFRYNIVVNEDGTQYTWPQNVEGTPLDWDFTSRSYYKSNKLQKEDPIILLSPQENDSNLEVTMIPENWNFRLFPNMQSPVSPNSYEIISTPDQEGKLIMRRYVGDELKGAPFISEKKNLVVKVSPMASIDGVSVGLTGKNGATYSAPIKKEYATSLSTKLHNEKANGVEFRVPLDALTQSETHIVPSVYPSFLSRELELGSLPFEMDGVEFVELVFPTKPQEDVAASIYGIWLE